MTRIKREQVLGKLQDKKLRDALHTIGIDYGDLDRILKTRDRKVVLHRNYYQGENEWLDEMVEEGEARRGIEKPEGTPWYHITLKGLYWIERQLVCVTFLMDTDYALVLTKEKHA